MTGWRQFLFGKAGLGSDSGILGQRQLLMAMLLVLATFFMGVIGYLVIERWPLLDAVYMTVITMTTVGFGETHPLSPAGRVFTTVLIAFGVLAIAAVVTAGSRIILEGQLDKIMGRRKVQKEISKLRNHYIICGYGRMGRVILQEFMKKGVPFIVIESSQEVFESIEEDVLALHGDATIDAVLIEAGIKLAKGLVSVVSSDAANVYIALTAKELAPNIFIVARAGEEGSEKKLMRAGADKVISPYAIGGSRIAHAILRPAVVDFIELVTRSEHLDLQLEEVEIHPQSSICNVTLPESGIRQNLNIIVVAIKKSSGHMVFNPSSGSILECGDRLIVLGGMENLAHLEEIARGKRELRSHLE